MSANPTAPRVPTAMAPLAFVALLFAGVLLVGGTFFGLQQRLENGRLHQLHLSHLAATAQAANAAEWRMTTLGASSIRGGMLAEIRQHNAELRRHAEATAKFLLSDATRSAVLRYVTALEHQTVLLEIGRSAEARRVDEEEVDPAFAALAGALNREIRDWDRGLERLRRTTFLAAAAILAGVAAVIYAFWQLQRTRRRALEQARDAGEAAARLDRERLDLALDAGATCTWDRDLGTDQIVLDARWGAMLGGPREPITTTTRQLIALVHPNDLRRVGAALRAVTSGETDHYFAEHRVRKRNGDWLWVRSEGRVAARDATGRATRMNGITVDVSAQRDAERATRDQMAFLSAMNETTLDLLGRSQLPELLQGIVVRAARLLDCPYAELCLLEDDTLVVRSVHGPGVSVPGDRSTRGEAVLSFQAIDRREPVLMDDFTQFPGGHELYRRWGLRAVAVLPILQDGVCLGVLGLMRQRSGHIFDSGDIRKAQVFTQLAALKLKNANIYEQARQAAHSRSAALHESEERFQLVNRAAFNVIWDQDIATGRIWWNEHFEIIYGHSVKEATPSSGLWKSCLHPEDRERVLAGVQTALTSPRTNLWHDTYRFRRKDGSYAHVEDRAHIVRDDAGRAIRMLGAMLDVTAQKQAEEALRVSEAHYRSLVEGVRQGYFVADRRGCFTYCNPSLHAMSGFELGTLVGRSSFRLVLEEDRPRVIAEYRRLSADPTVITANSEFRVRARHGRIYWVEQSSNFVRDNAGRVTAVRNLLHDITERRQAEAALRESEGRYRAVFDASPLIIGLLTVPEGRIVEVNNAAQAAFGYTREEAVGRTTPELGLWASNEDRDHYVRELQTKGSVRAFDTHMRRKDGTLINVLYSGSIVTLDGKPYSLNLLLDITARSDAENKFRALFAFAPDAIIIATTEGRITDVNQRALALFGFSREELIGRTAEVLIPPARRPELQERLRVYFTNPGPVGMGEAKPGLVAWDKSGRIFPIDISLSPLRTREGSFIVAAVRDTTRQLAAEESRLQAEAALRQSQRIESIGTLAGGIAHDFNNILTGILGSAEIARLELPPDHPAWPWLNNIASAGQRAKALVQKIMTFSRKAEGQMAPELLQNVVQEALTLLRSTLPSFVRLESRITLDCPPVLADGTQIHQVVMNLCTNAWHALPAQDGCIEVELAPVTIPPGSAPVQAGLTPGNHVRLAVRDNGSGMSRETLEHIFEPFFTTKEKGQGTGLGLAVVHGIIQAHRGVILVHSTRGTGSLFEIFLPVLAEGVLPASSAAPALTSPAPTGRHILLVDDDHLALSTLQGMLKSLGHRVTATSDSTAALQTCRAPGATFDLVVTDYAMQGLTGLEFSRQLLALRPDMPILLISGFLEPEQVQAILSAGVRSVLSKPVELRELSGALAEILPNPARA